jgi:hypothetical protein
MAIFHPALRLAALVVAIFVVASCGGGGAIDNQLSFRMIHVAPDSPPVNFLVDGVAFRAVQDYKAGTGFAVVTPRDYQIEMEAILPGGNVLIDGGGAKPLVAGREYSFVAVGNTTTVELLEISHPIEEIPVDTVRLEVLHAAPGVGALDVYLTAAGASLTPDGRIAGGIVFRQPVDRLTRPQGTYVIRVTPAGVTDNVLFESSQIPLGSRDDLLLMLTANTQAGPSPIGLVVNNRFSTGELLNKDTPSDLRVVHLSPDAPALDVVANPATPTSPEITFTNSVDPVAVVLDSANGRALTIDKRLAAVVAVNLLSGLRTVLSDSVTPGSLNRLLRPVAIALDSANDRALVVDDGLRAVVAVDLQTGARTILADSDGANPLSAPTGIAVDSANGRALVLDAGLRAVVAVNLLSGARTILSNNSTPDNVNPLSGPIGIALDSANNRALLVDLGPVSAAGNVRPAIVAVDLLSGARTIVSNDDRPTDRLPPVPPATTGLPINPFNNPVGIVLDGSRALVTDAGLRAVLAVDLATGARTVLSSGTVPDAVSKWGNPLGIALDTANNRALVADNRLGAVVAASLADGARTILSPNVPPNSLSYLERSAYVSVPIDVYTLRGEKTAEPSPATPLFTNTRTLGAGQRATLFAVGLITGTTPTIGDLVLNDDIRPVFAEGKLRIVHASPAAGTVDVYVLKPGDDIASVDPTLRGLVFRSVTGHGAFAIPAVPLGSYTVTFTLGGAKIPVVATAVVPVTGGSVQTVILRDAVRVDASSTGLPAAVLVLDDLSP